VIRKDMAIIAFGVLIIRQILTFHFLISLLVENPKLSLTKRACLSIFPRVVCRITSDFGGARDCETNKASDMPT